MVAFAQSHSDVLIFDRQLIKNQRERATNNFSDHNFLFDWAENNLLERLNDVNRTFSKALQIGSRSSKAKKHQKIESLITLDITNAPVQSCSNFVQGSEEFLPIATKSMDLVISNLNLHSVNDLPGALAQIQNTLKEDGLFMASMLGGETLYELRKIMMETELRLYGGTSPHIFPFADKPQMGELLQRADFALPVIDSEIITVTYDNAFKLFQDLRGMGEGNSIIERNKSPLGKSFFMDVAQEYQNQFTDDEGRIHATFEIIFLLGWAPHSSQQQPLRPGSAQHSLAEALETTEMKTGDKATP